MAGKLSPIIFMIIDGLGTICGLTCFILYLCIINMNAGKIYAYYFEKLFNNIKRCGHFLAAFSFLWMILAGFQLHIRYLDYSGSIQRIYGTNLTKMLTIVAIIAFLMCVTSVIGKKK